MNNVVPASRIRRNATISLPEAIDSRRDEPLMPIGFNADDPQVVV